MKNTYLYLAILIVLGTIAYFLVTKESDNTLEGEDDEFAIENIDRIHKIFIADRENVTATLVRQKDHWDYTTSDGRTYKARAAAIDILLQTIQKVQVRYKVQEAAMAMAVDNLATTGKKIEFYDKSGKRFKTYYVGGSSNDTQGTFMIMENSENPYVTHLQFWEGFLFDRYLVQEKDWRDKTVFSYKSNEIKMIQVDYPQQQSNSFILTQVKKGKFSVEPLYPTTNKSIRPIIDQKALAYLYNYERLIAEAFENENPHRSEILEKIPFATVTITTKDGTQKTVKFIPVIEEVEEDTDGTKVRPKIQRYFACVNGNEDVYLVQDLLFGKIFWGYDFFYTK